MSRIDRSFVAWEEHIICPDRGNRVVHYYLKNASGELVLAVVGTERSIRHMTYVASDEFLQVYGRYASFSVGLKWRARRDAVEWLTSFVSDHAETLDISNMETQNSVHPSGSFEVPASGSNVHQTSHLMTPKKVKPHNQSLDWYGNASLCAKQLKHYQAFCATETIVAVHSFVFIMSEEESSYLGYIEDMYEDKRGHKKIKVRWFHYGEEVKSVVPELNLAPREVLITNHVQVISAECFDCPAIVLTPSHYDKCLKVVPEPSILGIYTCFRQFNNNRIKSFCLAKLRGYANQAILPCLDDPKVDRDMVKSSKLNIPDEEKSTSADSSEVGFKRKRTGYGNQEPEIGIAKNSAAKGWVVKCDERRSSLKLKLPRKLMGIKFRLPQPPCSTGFQAGDKIELLCPDSGMRGCWFRCKILEVSHTSLKVLYDDLEDAEGPGNLEEWVSARRVAARDKLGMRCFGRPTIRPCPPDDSRECFLSVGAPIDAWWCDGWWEGVVIGHDNSGTDAFQVYLPGENYFLVLKKKNIRSSRDWIGNKWIAIEAKQDIVHYISSNIIPGTKPSGCLNLIRVPGRGGLALPHDESQTASSFGAIEEIESEDPLEVARATENQSAEAAPLKVDKPVLAEDLMDSVKQMSEKMETSMIGVPGCSGVALPQHENEGHPEVARVTECKRSCDLENVAKESGEEATLNLDNSVLAAGHVESARQMVKVVEAVKF